MKVENVFGYNVVRHVCEDLPSLLTPTLINSVNRLIEHPDAAAKFEDYKLGRAITTCGLPHLYFNKAPGNEELAAWIMDRIIESAKFFGYDNPKELKIGRNWINIQYKDSTGVCHTHSNTGKEPMVVAIFYASAPPGSADLVFVNNGRDKTMLSDYTEEERAYQNICQGELVIHDSRAYHTISTHLNEIPRVCFIFEIDFC
jgi:hypothetical protein